MPTCCDSKMTNARPFGLLGVRVAVGLPDMLSCVRPAITTVSWQVPVTVMEFGPAAGKVASAAVILVNAPGVAPLQSTAAPAAKATAGTSSRSPARSLNPEAHIFIVIFLLVLKSFFGKRKISIGYVRLHAAMSAGTL